MTEAIQPVADKPGPRGEKTRRQVLAAAEARFAEYGLQGTRVRDIAAEAGVNVATLYNYYTNKQALYEAVLDEGLQPIVEILATHSSEHFDVDTGLLIVDRILTHLQQRPGICKLIYLESINNGPFLDHLSERWFKPLAGEAMKYFDVQFTPEHQEQLIALFFHLAFGHFSLAPLLNKVFDTRVDSKTGVQRHADFTLNLLKSIFPELGNNEEHHS